MNYRMDGRSQKKFEKEIKEATAIEEQILNMWLMLIEKDTGKRPAYTALSKGRDGEFLKDSEVDSMADFEIEGVGKLEIKFCRPLLKERFHLKEGQLKKYLEQGAAILIVNGYDTKEPVYAMIKQDMMAKIIAECEVVNWQGMGFKKCYRVPTNLFIWRPLNG
jgi:hypothetical protein